MPSQKSYLEQVEVIAIGIAHLLLGKAKPIFPTTTRAHPSFWVTVHLLPEGALWPGATQHFPHRVRWDIWDNVVVPILQNEDHQFLPNNGADRNWRQVALLDAGAYDQIVSNLQEALIAGYKEKGYLPADPAPSIPFVSPPSEPGGPVDQTPEVDEESETYARYDGDVEPPIYIRFDMEIS